MITRENVRSAYPVAALEDVVDFLDHLRRPVKQSDRIDGPYPYYGANGQQGSINDFIFDEPLVLLAEDGGHFDNPSRGIAYQVQGKTWVNNHAHVLRPKDKIDIRFLTRVLEHYDVRPFINGSTRAKLTKNQAKSIEIPLPQLAEQKRIAGILDQAAHLVRRRQQALDKLNTLGQAIFYEMFGDVHSNPLSWPIVSVGQVTSCIVPGRNKPKSFTGDIPWITTAELVHLGVTNRTNSNAGLSDSEISEAGARIIPQNSVIMTCVGDLGVTSIAGDDMVINQQLHSFQCGEQVLPEFLVRVIPQKKNWMLKRATQTTLPYMNKSICNSVPIVLPPVEMQSKFAERIRVVRGEVERFKKLLVRKRSLFASLQHRAFRGEL